MSKLLLGAFASGKGSNFEAIINAIEAGRLNAEMRLLLSNKEDAGALTIAREHAIPVVVMNKSMYSSRDQFIEALLKTLQEHQVKFIALAGYMKMVPSEIIEAYRNRIVNIHPALLPAFGGKGMYGHHVHEAVLEQGCKITGVTVHIVDEVYDHGPIVAQRCVPVEDGDTADDLAARVLKVEHKLYAEVLQLFAEEKVTVKGRRVFIQS